MLENILEDILQGVVKVDCKIGLRLYLRVIYFSLPHGFPVSKNAVSLLL